MRITNRKLLLVILLGLTMTVSGQEQQTNKQLQGDDPLETVKITTDLVVLRAAVSDRQGRAAVI